jgi:hypothetical protein
LTSNNSSSNLKNESKETILVIIASPFEAFIVSQTKTQNSNIVIEQNELNGVKEEERERERERENLDDYALNIFNEISTRVGVVLHCLTNEVCRASLVEKEKQDTVTPAMN